MRRILTGLIVWALMMAGGMVCLADDTDTIGATILGGAVCEVTITSSSLNITAPTGVGPSSTAFTNSPIVMEILDNDITPSYHDDFLTIKGEGTEPPQYGSTYAVAFTTATWTPSGDNTVTPIITINDPYMDVDFSSATTVLRIGESPTGSVLHGTVSLPAYLYIDTGKRIRGDTSDSVTIQFTLVDF